MKKKVISSAELVEEIGKERYLRVVNHVLKERALNALVTIDINHDSRRIGCAHLKIYWIGRNPLAVNAEKVVVVFREDDAKRLLSKWERELSATLKN